MGLDIAFNRAAAVAAGMEEMDLANGDEEEIAAAETNSDPDPDYIKWLKESTPCIRVSGMRHWTDGGSDPDRVCVRANKWGRTYEPLTNFLKANGIEWSEF